jgi:hypothetical protein
VAYVARCNWERSRRHANRLKVLILRGLSVCRVCNQSRVKHYHTEAGTNAVDRIIFGVPRLVKPPRRPPPRVNAR